MIRPALWAVSLPYGFTLFSNILYIVRSPLYVSLPYGFTLFSNAALPALRPPPVSLPYGFTLFSNAGLAYSSVRYSFTTLWIYTILKPEVLIVTHIIVSLPYGFTLFSNTMVGRHNGGNVSLPYGFTLFSNLYGNDKKQSEVSLPYGFTLFSNSSAVTLVGTSFHYLMDLHYSQTGLLLVAAVLAFHYLMDLHYSQTKTCSKC